MASKKTEDSGEVPRAAPARGVPERQDPAAPPRSAGRPAGKAERSKLRDLLGDFSEQTGAFFG